MQIRRFTSDQHQAVEREGALNVTSLPIQVPVAVLQHIPADQLAERLNGAPLLGEANMGVIALHIGPHGHIDEHAASYPITCLVIGGHGFMRIGGPNGETVEVHAGDALLWPANEPHYAWTHDDALDTIVLEFEG